MKRKLLYMSLYMGQVNFDSRVLKLKTKLAVRVAGLQRLPV